MTTVRIERDGSVATLRLDREHANAINDALARDLGAALDEVGKDDAIRGVLLASAHPRVFCPGLDLRELSGLERPAMEAFLKLFCETYRRLFAFEKPVVAAMEGHAVAGGCVLALCADLRVLNGEGALLGLNEVQLGVPLPWGVSIIVRNAVPSSRLADVVLLGRNFTGGGAVEAGLAHESVPAGRVEARARERLDELAEKEPAALACMKRYMRAEAHAAMRQGDAERQGEFLDVWFSPRTQALLQQAAASLANRDSKG